MNSEIIEKEYSFLREAGGVYVDTCKLGIPPLRTQNASNNFMSGYREYSMGIDFERYSRTRGRVRKMLAELICGDEDEIAFTKNTTEAVSILASGYPLGPGDNVVTCDLENQSNLFPWFANGKSRGYEVKVAKTNLGRITPQDIEALIDENTKIVSLSVVQAGTGYFADLRAIGKICKDRGILLAVDAIQALGRMRVNVKEMGISYLSCGGFKGLLSGLGIGFLWCDKNIINNIIPPYVGFMSAGPYMAPPKVTSSDEDFFLYDGIDRLEAGSQNAFGATMMESSIGLLLELGPDTIQEHILNLEDMLRDRLKDMKFQLLTPESRERQSGMLVMYYPKEHYESVAAVFEREHIVLSHRAGYIRMAIGIHNTAEDIEKIAAALEEAQKAFSA